MSDDSRETCPACGDPMPESCAGPSGRHQPIPAAVPDPRFRDQLAEARVHDLKTWPPYFAEVLDGRKPFEIRRDDRVFAVGDTLRLREWMPASRTYTGRECQRTVTCITRGWGLPVGTVVLGLAEPAAEVKARVQAAANQRAAEELEAAADVIDLGPRFLGDTTPAQVNRNRANFLAAALASPAPGNRTLDAT